MKKLLFFKNRVDDKNACKITENKVTQNDQYILRVLNFLGAKALYDNIKQRKLKTKNIKIKSLVFSLSCFTDRANLTDANNQGTNECLHFVI